MDTNWGVGLTGWGVLGIVRFDAHAHEKKGEAERYARGRGGRWMEHAQRRRGGGGQPWDDAHGLLIRTEFLWASAGLFFRRFLSQHLLN